MKKILFSMLALTMAAFTFTSCEDVPEAYEIPGAGGGNGGEEPGVAEEPAGDGTLANPFNVVAAIKYINDGGSEETEMYVKGIVVSVDNGSYDPSYGSLKYYISDDGTTQNQFRVYNGYAGPNRTKFSGEDALKQGDVVVICGKLLNYNGTLEFTTGNYVVSINGNEGVGGGDDDNKPSEGTYIGETFEKSFGVFEVKTIKGLPWIIDSYGYAKATGYDNASKTTTSSASYIVSKAVDMSASKEATVTFDYVLRYVTTEVGEPIDGIVNKVLVTDNYTGDPTTTNWTDITGVLTEVRDWKSWTKFSATVPTNIIGKNNVVFALYYGCEASSSTWEVKNFVVKEGKEENTGGEEKPNPGGEVSENSITVISSSFGLDNGTEVGTQTLIDGTTLAFEGGGNQNVPKYYNSGTNIRMYPKNSMTIKSSKKIESVVIACDEYQGVICNASGDVKSEPGTVKTEDKNIVVSSINANEVKISNTSQTTGAPSQIRMLSLTINYVK